MGLRRRGGWVRRIDLDRLDLASAKGDALGQRCAQIAQGRGDLRRLGSALASAPQPHPTSTEVPLMWSDLPKNLKTALGIAILGAIGVAAAGFRLSFIALREVASRPGLKFGHGNAWLLPVLIDAGLVVAEVILLAASMVRVRNQRGELETYDRTVPFLLVLAFGGASIYFNVTRVPADLRAVTVIPPAGSILMTIGLAYLLKMLARVSGADVAYEAPPPLDPRVLTRRGDVVYGEIVRGPEVRGYPPGGPSETLPGAWPAYGQPWWAPSQIQPDGQIRQPSGNGELTEATKRHRIEAYLAALGADQLARLAGLGPKAAARELTPTLNGQGVAVSERYVQQILDEFLAAQATQRKPK